MPTLVVHLLADLITLGMTGTVLWPIVGADGPTTYDVIMPSGG